MRAPASTSLEAVHPAAEVSAEQSLELIAGGAILLDVREQHEWDAGHAPQAQHLPMSQLNERVGELAQDVQLVCVCHVGGRSAAVSSALNRAGWQAVNLAGGMLAWHAAGLPVIDDQGRPGVVD
jgi:rhodanese-related sulfurtransferase